MDKGLMLRRPKRTLALGALLIVAALALSFVHPWGDLRAYSSKGAILAGSGAPEEVRAVIEKKCGDCHSANTHWPLYARIAPSSWLLEHDVAEGREHMNLSRWESYGVDGRIDMLARIATQLRQGKMPLKPYLLMHPEARLSDAERQMIMQWTKAERKRLMDSEAK
jgi:cytochrome c